MKEFLQVLSTAEISLALDGEALVVKGDRSRLTAEIKAKLVAHKAELVEYLKSGWSLAGNGAVLIPPNLIKPDSPAITPEMLPLIDLTQADIAQIIASTPGGIGNIQDIYQLTALQDGILFHHRLAGEGDPYLLSSIMSFPQRSTLELFLQAVQEVVQRHDILRTAFVWEGLSRPAQVVVRQAKLSVQEVSYDPANGSIEAQLMAGFGPRHYRVEVSRAPLLSYVIAHDPVRERWVALQLFHHLVGDHSTLALLREEVFALCGGQQLSSTPAEPFRNLVAQARFGMSQQEHESFFRGLLGEISEPTLAFGLSNVQQQGDQVIDAHKMFSAELNERLRQQARRHGVSLASLCHLAWGQVLSRSVDEEQVVFGTVLLGRMQSGDSSTRAAGLFINTLPFRVDLGSASVITALRQTHTRLAELFHHEHASLALAQRCSGVAASSPLFNAMLNYRHGVDLSAGDASISSAHPLAGVEVMGSQERTNYPITVSIEDFGQSLGVTAQIVQPLSAERMCGYVEQALESLAYALEHAPETPMHDINILPAEERSLLLDTWNVTDVQYPNLCCIAALFEEQVKRTPQAIAVVHAEHSLTYAALNAHANRLAAQLRARGIGPDMPVATLFERSILLVIAQLAIAKVGAIYVPLDAQVLKARQDWILADCGASLLLKEAGNPAEFTLDVLELKAEEYLQPALQANLQAENVALVRSSEAAAYIMYTSGSTGTPKGVIVPHRAISKLVMENGYAAFDASDRIACVSNPAFDASTMEVWGALLNGGQIVIIDANTFIDAEKFEQALQQYHITALFLTTSLFKQYAQQIAPALSHVKYLMIGGERADPESFRRVLQEHGEGHLINCYGPTETTTFAIASQITEHEAVRDNLPIGKPIANTRAYLLDAHWKPVPLGAVGELYIGGKGVALGYLNRPEINQERFLDDPFCPAPDAAAPECIHQYFEMQAKQTPLAIALSCEGRELSYQELNQQANRLAWHLLKLGVRKDQRIAICLDRSESIVIGLLAILKAGAAYVPLDPAYSSERLALILNDCAPAIVLSDAVGRAALGEAALQQGLGVDLQPLSNHAACPWDGESSADPELPELAANHLAYVIYTSGSTGTPKGVMVEHAQVVRLFDVTNDLFSFQASDVWCLFHSYAFDFSVWELWGALRFGARLVIVPHAIARSSDDFYNLVCQQKITVLNQTPSAFRGFIEAQGNSQQPHALRYVIFGGEALEPSMLKPWYARHAQDCPQLVNMYGITETTVHATYHALEASDLEQAGSPVGKRLADLHIYLLDAQGEPVPLQAAGEVYVGGAGVARGYLNRPELTAERFLRDPFRAAPGARMYKTGDLARYLPDGTLEFLGRNDDQIKIRGFRIEPGEIEARLTEHPQVREAVVMARGTHSDKRLIAYVITHDALADELKDDAALANNLRSHIAATLPDYMLPSAYVRMQAWPLTANGKLDRKALPAPQDDAFARSAYVAPEGEVEQTIAAIWQSLLGVEKVSRYDNFFELGGHSLLAVQLIERLRQHKLRLEVRRLFTAPVLCDLAAAVDRRGAVQIPPNLITPDSQLITPEMLPLIDLSQAEIDRIVAQIPGGIANIQDIYALAPLQDGILFHHRLAEEGDPYLLSSQRSFPSRALLDSFLAALQGLVDRHDILRTAFIWQGISEPAQVVLRKVRLPVLELTLDPADGPVMAQLATRFDPRRQGMDLTQAPLLHYVVVHDTENARWVLLQRFHHLIGDHSTLDVLRGEVAALMAGKGATLPKPPAFRNLVAQVRLGLSAAEHEAYFRSMLADIDEPSLPFGIADVHQAGTGVREMSCLLPQEMSDGLRQQSRRLGVSVASVCHLAWGQVLARLLDRQQVVFGTVLFGRIQSSEGADRAAGLFINTLPLRVDIDDTDVAQTVRQTQSHLADLLTHEHASLALAQRCSGVAAPSPLFSSVLNYRHNQVLRDDTEGAEDYRLLEQVEFLGNEERTNYPITMSVEDFGDRLGLTALVIDRLSAERLCAYMQQALESLLHALEFAPQTAVRQLEVLPAEELRALTASADLALHTPLTTTAQCIHQHFERIAAEQPNATAVVLQEQHLSYAELNAQANRLAHYLLAQGVEAEERIALAAERGIALVVGLLAIFKAGAAYIPLDPVYSSERLQLIIDDSAPRYVLADAAGRAALGAQALQGRQVIDLDQADAARVASAPWADLAASNPQPVGLSGNSLAYVIYTSGSTGVPKGVMVEHAQITRLFSATEAQFAFNQDDVWCLFHSYAFDFSVWEMWGAWRYGGRLVIVPHQIARSMPDFYALVCSEGVTVLNQTPTAFREFIEVQAASNVQHALRYVIFGGEALEPSMLKAWYARHPQQPTLVNMYGITETTVHVTYRALSAQDCDKPGSLIGQALSDLRIYLLDSQARPVPAQTIGEIYVGGLGVARGYLNRAELNAERFLADPFSSRQGARMYRSGDLARYAENGELEYLGRNDHQVKIRGFRIELGEIEARLTEHALVREALVLPVGEGKEKQLVAYLIAANEQSSTASDDEETESLLAGQLRAHLASCLPDYMLPSAFVRVSAWPLTPNGKLDRKALPEVDGQARARRVYVAPQGPIESMLAEIWQELLDLPQVGRNDHFFELGGHSLLAMQLIEKLRRKELQIEVRRLFAAPVLHELAAALGQHRSIIVPPNLIQADSPTITPQMLPLIDLQQQDIDRIVAQVPGGVANIQDIYGLAPLQDGILFHHRLTGDADPYMMRSHVTFPNRQVLDSFIDAVQQLVNRHDILRTAFFWQGLSVPAQVVLRQAKLSVTELHLQAADGPLAQQLSQRYDASHHSIDLSRAPLVSFVIAQEPDSDRWITLQLRHHLIEDAVSVQIFRDEINAIMQGQGAALPAPPPFRNMVAQARLGLSVAEHESYFRNMLGDIAEPSLPYGLTDVHRSGGRMEQWQARLPQALDARLRQQARRLGIGLASLCHLAWGQVLARLLGHDSVVFGTVLFGRMQGGDGADRAVGLFINTLPLRLDLGELAVEQAALQTQQRLAGLMEHEHASLALAQRCSGVNAAAPLFSSVINYRNLISKQPVQTAPAAQALADTQWEMGDRYTNYPVMVTMEDFGDALGCIVHLMQPYSAERLWQNMAQTLDSLVMALESTPQQAVSSLDVLPQAERNLLLHEWNASQSSYPHNTCTHQLFEQQVLRSPDAIAVLHQGHALSYQQLNAEANRLAQHLRSLGVQADEVVAICVERSVAMVIGLLAIMKSGAAYVPLDPVYPSERLARVMQDAAPRLCLADAAGRLALGQAALANCQVLDMQALHQGHGHGHEHVHAHATAWAAASAENPPAQSHSSNLAYVMYTSGSTGVPKGVQIEHRQLTNFLCSMASKFMLGSEDVWLAVTSVAFDIAGLELYLPLISGAPLVLAGHTDALDPQRLQALMQAHQVRIMQATPASWKALMATGWQGAAELTVLCGGEAMPAHFPAWFTGRCKALWNLYGPTETTIWSSCLQVLPNAAAESYSENSISAVSIGRPIANTRLYVLDGAMQPVPVGGIGELYIAGDGVGRGYLQRPQLNASQFMPDPFVSNPADAQAARMYRTGDLARYRPDGLLECLGRNDDQVKIRGFRIELGEIEARLNEHAQVREAAVVVRMDGAEKRLVAYLVAADATPSEELSAGLRAYLQACLPDYMVPAAMIWLASMPLTPNGKLDRKALPEPAANAYVQAQYLAPEGEVEVCLAQLWQELLGLPQVGRHDDFFALGGHSLLVVRLLVRVRQELGVELSVASFFAHASLSAMASTISAAGGALANANTAKIPQISRTEAMPLSFAQQRLWFLAQLEGTAATYHMPAALRLRGQLDLPALQRSFDAVMARHEALRSVFITVDGQPELRLLPADIKLPLREEDLPASAAQDQALAALSAQETSTPFDLAQGPLIRARLLRLAPDEHVLLLTQHHIVSDGWSVGVLTRELSALYQAFHAGQENPLPALPIQYPDYAAWQRQWLDGERLQRQTDFWQHTLRNLPALLTLPTDRPRPSQQDFRAALLPISLDADLSSALQRFSQQQGSTMFMTVMTAWAAVLARLSGQEDVVIGTPTANRNRAETEGLIGLFVNTLALPVHLEGTHTLAQILAQVRGVAMAAQDHQDLPFEQVVEIVRPQRNLSHAPIFQVLFNWQNNDVRLPEFGTLEVSPAFTSFDFIKFDLELALGEVDGKIVGNLKYATSLFDAASMQRHLGYLQTMLWAMVAEQAQSLAQIDLVSAEERFLQLETWNATQAPFPDQECIHQLFEAQVQRTPDAPALTCAGQTLSYAELNRQANQLAHHLLALGVQIEDRVAICLERSVAMVVGLLAIMKAGGAYVPLDPAYPAERLADIIEDAAPIALLLDAAGRSALQGVALDACTVLDTAQADWATQAQSNPQLPGLDASKLAYVIFTSGSTGRPKGVMNEHRPVVNRLTWSQAGFAPLHSDDVVLQKTSFGFDVSVWEFFWTLLHGARLLMAPPQAHKDPAALLDLIRQEAVTTVHFVPSMLGVFLLTEGVERCTSLRHLFCSGEALPSVHVQRSLQVLPHVQLYNLYGPTEAAIEVTAWQCPAGFDGSVPIGRPIANVRTYVLDELQRPVPLGSTGQLHIAGIAVARGYFNRPELSAERFVADPFSRQPQARMYKTGDLVRYLADGQIEYFGRNDHQVKVRGFRIELGEIESRLCAHPQVREAVVLAREIAGEMRLVGYVVPATDALDAAMLRSHLAASLPDYMLPSVLMMIDALPVTPNGKLDRQALPQPSTDAYASKEYVAPVGEVEQTLAAVWQELLQQERVGRHDDFFELGGHSLLAVRMVAQVRQRLGIELSLATLFGHASLETLAQALIEAGGANGVRALPPIAHLPRDAALPLSFAQLRLWFLAQWQGVSASYHIPLAVRLQGPLQRAALRRALDTLLARHESLRTVFVALDGTPEVQLLPANTAFVLREENLQGRADAEQALARFTAEEMQAPFDLAQGPLIRGCLLQLAHEDHVLLLTQHHIVSDGWSIGVLTRELGALYRAFVSGRENPLAPLPIQYPDYAAWQRQWLSGERLQQQTAHWRQALANAPVLLEIPTDRPRTVQQDFSAGQVPFELDAELTAALRRISRQHGATMFMTLLAAWAAVLARLSGQDEVVIGTPTANRGRAETEGLIGFFVNTLALPINLAGAPNVAELLARVRSSTLGAQDHQDLPFEQVVEIVQPPRSLEHTPIFQVMFSWQKFEREALDLPGLQVVPATTGIEPIKFELELNLNEVGDVVRGNLSYAKALFDAPSIERQVGYLRTLLQVMASNAELPLASVDLLTPEEHALQQSWNPSNQPFPQQHGIHQLFEQHASRQPEATALVYQQASISYGLLNAQANRLAHHLIALGVGPDQAVAICMERGPALILAMLAILKAGAAYVPLDATYPADRLRHVLLDSAPAIVLTDALGRQALEASALAGRQVLALDAVQAAEMSDPSWAAQPTHNPQVAAFGPHNLAYVIYTSGSTGMPKGVAIEHLGLCNQITALQHSYGLSPSDRVLQFAGPSFDMSVEEIFGALSSGACLVLGDRSWITDPQHWLQLCESFKLTVANLPTQFWQQLAQNPEVPMAASLRQIAIGGEAVTQAALESWWHRPGHHPVLWNAYGPTEATVNACLLRCAPDDHPRSIGRPVANACIYLLDCYGHRVPLGAIGEIYIGGVGVAREYLNRPELNAERFVADPFSQRLGARMYRSGDLARYLPDGQIEFLGRNDYQVKIRGFRIELGEIETLLSAHPQVREALVIAREENGDRRLVAYLIAHEPPADSDSFTRTLRSYLAASLPDYMVPAAFVLLTAWPLTANGKMDRQALPAPDAQAYARSDYAAPQGELEQALAQVWQELLHVAQVGRDDDFFELGGHSLLVVQLLDKMRQLGVGADVRTVFAASTVAKLAAAVSSYQKLQIPANCITPESTVLTPEMLPLIELEQADIDAIITTIPGGLANVQDIYALSPLQEGLLFHHLRATKGDPYLHASKLSFNSRAMLERFLLAAQQVVDRHDILRTAFLWQGLSKPAQVVLRHAPIHVNELVLDERDGPIVDQLSARYDASHYRFDIGAAPLLHFVIAEDRANQRWVLLYITHHLIDDHASLSTLRDEIFAILAGKADQLEAAQPFRNLVARSRLGASAEEHQAYFRKMLADVTEPTLPFGTSDVHQSGGKIDRSWRMLSAPLRDQLRAQGKRLGVSLASLCHLAWAQVLARSVGNNRVVFGTVLLGRMQADEQVGRTIGLFINTLPIRIDLDGMGVAALAKQTQTHLAELLMHEHASLADAQQCSGVPGNQALFSALLNYRHSDAPVNQAANTASVANVANDAGNKPVEDDLNSILMIGDEVSNNYPITLSVDDFGDDIGLTTLVNSPLQAERICAYMEQALASLAQALAEAPHTSAHTLNILPPDERELLLHTWNASETAFERERCIHQVFENQVSKTPDALAVMDGAYTLSYAELNAQANRLAHHLVAQGVPVGGRVAICVDRSPAMVVAILATMKTGASYTPLDPAYTSDRLAQILHDSAPSLLLADATGRQALGEAACQSLPVIDLQALRQPNNHQAWQAASAENLQRAGITAEHLAYIIYTSGSTGTPKGVMVEHRSLVNFHAAVKRDIYPGEAARRIGWNASFSFDMSMKGFLQLLSGHCLVIIPQQLRASSADFMRFLQSNAIDGFDMTPSLLRALIAEGLLDDPYPRTILLGGEATDLLLWQQLRNCRQHTFHNMYGPTECTVDGTMSVIAHEDEIPHIGRRLSNTRIYLLDEYGQPVPLGAKGELYIGGVCVARGYFNRPDLTEERFLPDPFSREAGARIYKTGDLAHYLPDGKLVYHGRNDHQVKIRGFRVELGEIDARLNEQESVREAVVVARDEGIDLRLIAYVVPRDPAAEMQALASELRAKLAERLPEYMLPLAYVKMAALPLTPNGKLDRKALPAPDDTAFSRQSFDAPQGDIEITLAAIWADLLKLEQIGRHDDFFALGGHSLLALHLILKSRQAFAYEVVLQDLFAGPTLAEFANIIAQGVVDTTPRNLIAVRSSGQQRPLFLIHPGGGGIDYARQLATVITPEVPIYGLEATGLNVGETPLHTVQEMASRYIQCIQQVQASGPYQLAGWSAGGTIAYEMGRQLLAAGAEVAFIGLIDTFCDLQAVGHTVKEEFDDKAQLLDFLVGWQTPEVHAQVQALAASLEFSRLVEQIFARQLVPQALANMPILSADAVRAMLHTRHTINLAVQQYQVQAASLPVCLFEASENETSAVPHWQQRLGTQLQVVSLPGNHLSLIDLPEHRAALGQAMSEALANLQMELLTETD